MSILETLYNYEIPKISYKDRKLILKKENTILFYPAGSGATYCIFNFLSFLDEASYLYIDFDDLRVDKEYISKNLEIFLQSKKDIKILVIDNFDFSFEISNKTINILTTKKIRVNKRGYKYLSLYPLDFEEYVSFHSFINIQNVFSDFIQDSSLPSIALINKELKIKQAREYIKNQSKNNTELEILKEIIKSQGLLKTNYQIYNKLKHNIKISKNKLYDFIEILKNREIIFLLDKYNTKNSAKKIQLIDLFLIRAVKFDKNPYSAIENAVFLELIKRTKEKIYYTDNLNFYIKKLNLAIIVGLFMEKDFLKNKLKNNISNIKKLNIKKVLIINISEEFSFHIKEIEFIATPFYMFANGDIV
jgi:hypothetical protein